MWAVDLQQWGPRRYWHKAAVETGRGQGLPRRGQSRNQVWQSLQKEPLGVHRGYDGQDRLKSVNTLPFLSSSLEQPLCPPATDGVV